jgi:hypothetical protein
LNGAEEGVRVAKGAGLTDGRREGRVERPEIAPVGEGEADGDVGDRESGYGDGL